MAATTPSQDFARGLLTGETKLRGFTVDQDKRWDLTRIFARLGTPDAEPIIRDELAQDATDNGKKAAARSRAMIANAESKRDIAQDIFSFTSKKPEARTSIATLKQAMRNFHVLGGETFTRAVQDEYFSRLPQLAQSDDEEYNSALVEYFFPDPVRGGQRRADGRALEGASGVADARAERVVRRRAGGAALLGGAGAVG